VASEDQGQKD